MAPLSVGTSVTFYHQGKSRKGVIIKVVKGVLDDYVWICQYSSEADEAGDWFLRREADVFVNKHASESLPVWSRAHSHCYNATPVPPVPEKPVITRGNWVEFQHAGETVLGIVFSRYGQLRSERLNITLLTGKHAGDTAYPYVDRVKLVHGMTRILSREDAR